MIIKKRKKNYGNNLRIVNIISFCLENRAKIRVVGIGRDERLGRLFVERRFGFGHDLVVYVSLDLVRGHRSTRRQRFAWRRCFQRLLTIRLTLISFK